MAGSTLQSTIGQTSADAVVSAATAMIPVAAGKSQETQSFTKSRFVSNYQGAHSVSQANSESASENLK